METAAQKRDISGAEGDWPPSEVRGLCRDRHLAKFVARVSFATAIFAAAGASEAVKDDNIADATCFRERLGLGKEWATTETRCVMIGGVRGKALEDFFFHLVIEL